MLPHWSTTFVSSGASTALVATDGGVARCRGNQVLESTAGCCDEYSVALKNGALPDPVYARLFFQVPSSARVAFVDLLGFGAPNETFNVGVRFADTALSRLMVVRPFPGGVLSNLGPVDAGLVHDRWTCLEAAVHFDATAGWIKLSVDGQQVADFENVATVPAGASATSVRLGVERTPSNQTALAQVYYDEVVISDRPIGCR
jgi:hypothetical protein